MREPMRFQDASWSVGEVSRKNALSVTPPRRLNEPAGGRADLISGFVSQDYRDCSTKLQGLFNRITGIVQQDCITELQFLMDCTTGIQDLRDCSSGSEDLFLLLLFLNHASDIT